MESVSLDGNGIGQTTIDDFGIFVPPPGVAADTMIYIQLDGDIQREVNIGHLWNTDNQQLDSLTFDPQTNILTAFLENGGSKSVDLSSLNNSGTDSQTLSLSNDSILISNGNGIDISQYMDNTDQQQIDTFYYDAANQQIILSIENGGTDTVQLSPIGLTGATGATGATEQPEPQVYQEPQVYHWSNGCHRK